MSLANLQKHLHASKVNPNPPHLYVGETAFCTSVKPNQNSKDSYMWVTILGVDAGDGISRTTRYCIQANEHVIKWIDPKYFWTRAQLESIARDVSKHAPPWERDLEIPNGLQIKDPEALIQATLNLLRDAKIEGRRGYTNVPAVKCNVDNLCLGHFYKVFDAIGDDVCKVINEAKKDKG